MAERKRRTPPPEFLEKENYRRRRIGDAARVVPILGGVLVMLPLLWPDDDGARISTVTAYLYVFAIWAAMILLAAILAPLLTRRDEED